MKIFSAQLNPMVGDVKGNTAKILEIIEKARAQKADIVVFPELSICGYPPRDLLLFKDFIAEIENSLTAVIENSKGLFIALGTVRKTNKKEGNGLYNTVAVIADGKLLGYKDKTLLPTHDIFNEKRYFESENNQKVWIYKDKKIGVLICEDAWQQGANITGIHYKIDPVIELQKLSPDICLLPVASPYYYNKNELRLKIYSKVAKALNCPLITCSQIGANDHLVFDGYSMYFDSKGTVKKMAKGFVEDAFVIDTNDKSFPPIDNLEDPVAELYCALVVGVRDYFSKLNFSGVCLGLSGGIDSALTASIAVDALGKDNVKTWRMPSRFSSISSIDDSEILAENLNIEVNDMPIDSMYQHFLDLLSPTFYKKPFDTTEENLQARIRGMILMAISNKFGYLVLSTGNKSETALGYVTLYGDMCGGLSVLGDVSKTMVYKLAVWVNRNKEIIPENIITKPPSAELRDNQTDQDTLPPYEIIDLVLEEYVENHKSLKEIVASHNLPSKLVEDLITKIHKAEYKRRQGPPCIRVTKKAFGAGRIFPIVQGWA